MDGDLLTSMLSPGDPVPLSPAGLVVLALKAEREYQKRKYGPDGHTIGGWLLIIESELEEAKLAAIKPATGRDNVISEIIQIMATCCACLEQHGVEPIEGRTA